jgi:hypothetical protein
MQWDAMILHEAKIWTEFNRFWINCKNIPVLVIRYEDLVMWRELTLRRVCCFMWGLPQPMKFIKLPDSFNHNLGVNSMSVHHWSDDALFGAATPKEQRGSTSAYHNLGTRIKNVLSISPKSNHKSVETGEDKNEEAVAVPPSIEEQNKKHRWDVAETSGASLFAMDGCSKIIG